MASIINTGPGLKDAGAQLYLDTLQGYKDREAAYSNNYANNIAGWENLYRTQGQYGDSERLRLNQDFGRQLGMSQASMVSRGLGNTTVLDSAARGINYDRANASLTLNDQLLQRQNQIAQGELGYMGQYQQGLAGIQGDRLGWMGGVQQNTQAQNFQGAMQENQYGQQQELNKQQFGYSQQAAQQGFSNQFALAQQAYNNQRNIQNEFGYYAEGGTVQPQYFPFVPIGIPQGGPHDVQVQTPAFEDHLRQLILDAQNRQPDPEALAIIRAVEDRNRRRNAAAPVTGGGFSGLSGQQLQPQPGPRGFSSGGSVPPATPPAQQAYNNQRNIQMPPAPPPMGTDTVPARLTPGEFVLSREMIAALESGALDQRSLVDMIRRQRMSSATPAPVGYASGGLVRSSDAMMARMRAGMEEKERRRMAMPPSYGGSANDPEMMGGGMYAPRGRYG